MIRLFQSVESLLGEAPPFEADEIESRNLERVTGGFDVRGDVFGYPITTSNDGMATDLNELVDGHDPSDNNVIVDLDVTSDVHGIGKNNVIADSAVVSDMDVGHQETVAADYGFVALSRTAMKAAKLPYGVSIPDFEGSGIALIFEVLGSIA